jgi:hypothetical protein
MMSEYGFPQLVLTDTTVVRMRGSGSQFQAYVFAVL